MARFAPRLFNARVACVVGLLLVLMSRISGDELQQGGSGREQAHWSHDRALRQLVATADASVARVAQQVATDRLRPAFHFLPAGRFMNDPNGCVQFGDEYHVFYQHLPFWGEKNVSAGPGWGHAVSRDLVHWQRLPIALMPVPGTYDAEAVASGGCVIADGLPTIVYTSVSPQAQSLARSFDGMRTWRRYDRNPVVQRPTDIPGLEDGFRDPFVWRDGSSWRMVVGSGIRGTGGTVLLYESPDLLSWRLVGPLCVGMGADCFQWECPNFFRLGDQWVLVVSPLLHSIPSLRGPVQYAVGRFDGRHFEPGPWHALDLGGPAVFYAPNSLADHRARRIQWGWLMGGGSPDVPWNGLLTIPRILALGDDHRLRIEPATEVETLRGAVLADLGPSDLKPDSPLTVGRSVQFDLLVELRREGSGPLTVELFRPTSGNPAAAVSFDPTSGVLRCGDTAGIVPLGPGPSCELRLLVDRSVIEVYADHRAVMSLRAFPPAGADAMRLVAPKRPVRLDRVRAWTMKAIW